MRHESNKKPFYKRWWFFLIVFMLFCGFVSSLFDSDDENDETTRTNPVVSSESSASNVQSVIEQEDQQDKSTAPEPDIVEMDLSDYMKLDASVLYEYGPYLTGEKVATVITVADKDSSMLKARTDNNDGFMFSIVCEFGADFETDAYNNGDVYTVAGTVKEPLPVGSTVTLENCSIVGKGELAQELSGGIQMQKETCEQFKQGQEAEAAAADEEDRATYISQCQTYSYSDIERNPDSYEGKQAKISGEVIQVSEGILNTVTLRVDCGGDIWYVSYSRSEGESRILEGDTITCYGECDGVTSYITVIGSQVTIPSLDMKYYE